MSALVFRSVRFALTCSIVLVLHAPAVAELTVTEKLIRDEIIKLGGDLEAPKVPELVGFFGDKFTEEHFEMLSHLPTVRWFVVDHAPATERAFALLKECPCLEEIHLMGPQQFDGRGLGRLVLQRNLRELMIDDAQLSDAGFDELMTLTTLKVLTLSDIDFPVGRLGELGQLTKLQELLITSTRPLDDNEIAKLRAALPECDVQVSGAPAAHSEPLPQQADRATTSEDAEVEEILDKLKAMSPPKWELDRLAKEAEVIVIGTLDRTVEQPEADYRDDPELDDSFRSVDSHFTVLGVLRGEKIGETVTVAHLAWPPDTANLSPKKLFQFHKEIRMPALVGIQIEGEPLTLSAGNLLKDGKQVIDTVVPRYMLFLKRDDQGRLVPVSGQAYAALSAMTLNFHEGY